MVLKFGSAADGSGLQEGSIAAKQQLQQVQQARRQQRQCRKARLAAEWQPGRSLLAVGLSLSLGCSQVQAQQIQTVPPSALTDMAKPLPKKQVDITKAFGAFVGLSCAVYLLTLGLENNARFFPMIVKSKQLVEQSRAETERLVQEQRSQAAVEDGMRSARDKVLGPSVDGVSTTATSLPSPSMATPESATASAQSPPPQQAIEGSASTAGPQMQKGEKEGGGQQQRGSTYPQELDSGEREGAGIGGVTEEQLQEELGRRQAATVAQDRALGGEGKQQEGEQKGQGQQKAAGGDSSTAGLTPATRDTKAEG